MAPYAAGELGARSGIACDLLLVCGGWNPAVHLFSQARGKLRYDADLGAFVPGSTIPAASVAGAATGELTLQGALAGGARARRGGPRAARTRGRPVLGAAEVAPAPAGEPTMVLWSVPEPDPGVPCTRFVDLQRDATVADVLRATGAGLRSVEHVKRYTTIGTAHDQGKTSGVIASGIVAEALGVDVAELGTTTFRPPYTPVGFAALAGRDRGELHDPVRVTAIHDWHVEHGAEFEDVGPVEAALVLPPGRGGHEQAVLRECAATRSGCRHDGRLHPRQDRRPGPGRRRVPGPCSTPT